MKNPRRVFENLRIDDENLIQFGWHQFHLFLKTEISRQAKKVLSAGDQSEW